MKKYDLVVVIPVYDEEEIIKEVIQDWLNELKRHNITFLLYVIDDGSKDNTPLILQKISSNNENLEIMLKHNEGHGLTILQGYKKWCNEADYIFQVDSDNEIKANFFSDFWRMKSDLVIGIRVGRKQSFFRKILTKGSLLLGKILKQKQTIKDLNCPYRLYKTQTFCKIFDKVIDNTFAPNVILSMIAQKLNLKVENIPVKYEYRTTGVDSINKYKAIKIAFIAFIDVIKNLQRFKNV